MQRVKNAALVFCLFIVLLVIFSSYFRANEVGTLFGALAGTPLLVHIFNRLVPSRKRPGRTVAMRPSSLARSLCRGPPNRLWCFGWKGRTGEREP